MTEEGSLAPYRVLDLTSGGSSIGPRLLADLGADVIKVEPSGGDPARGHGPSADDSGLPNDALGSWFLDRGKRSTVIDLDRPDHAGRFEALVRSTDALVTTSSPEALAASGWGIDALFALNPSLVITTVTPFGTTGPRADFRGPDLVLAATSGMAWLCGDTDRPPVRMSVAHYDRHGGAEAAVHTLVALLHARRTGTGQHVDVASQLAGIRTLMNATSYPTCHGMNVARQGPHVAFSQAKFRLVMPTSDGHVVIHPIAGPLGAGQMRHFMARAVAAGIDVPQSLLDIDWLELDFGALSAREDGAEVLGAIDAVLVALMGTATKHEWYAEALEHGLLLAPVQTVADLGLDEQLLARGYFTEVEQNGRTVTQPGHWCRPSGTPLRAPAPAPTIGQHDTTIELDRAPRRVPHRTDASHEDPFAGLKVFDMSWVGVGPMTARYLGDYGATVVRLDSTKRPDTLRLAPPFFERQPGINRSQFYADFNASKLGIGIDITSPGGREVVLELVEWADVVVESFTPKTLTGLDLGYERLRQINPELVMLSTCMQGQTGPRANYRGFGSLMAAMVGAYHLTGWPDRDPVPVYGAYTDFICQRLCATALIAAIDHQQRTGEGQHIDLAQSEAALQFFGPEILDYEVNGRVASRQGNRDPEMAPHGIFPCASVANAATGAGEESWVAIAIEDDQRWVAFRKLLGEPTWANGIEFDTFGGRKANEALLEARIGEWTSARSAQDIVDLLQPRVAAGVVAKQSDLYVDPQVRHRGYFETLHHSTMGDQPYNGMQATMSLTPARLRKAAPEVGEDTHHVLTAILGHSDDRIADLLATEAVEIS